MSAICEFLDHSGETTPTVTKIARVTVDGPVNLSSYNDVTAKLEQAIRHNGDSKMRMLERIINLSWFDPLAIVPNSSFILRNYSAFERVAVVTDNGPVAIGAMALAPAIMPIEVRTYPATQLSDATSWVVEGLSEPVEAKQFRAEFEKSMVDIVRSTEPPVLPDEKAVAGLHPILGHSTSERQRRVSCSVRPTERAGGRASRLSQGETRAKRT